MTAALIFALAALAGCSTTPATSATQTPADAAGFFQAKADEAAQKSCFAEQRMIDGATRIYYLENGALPPSDWKAFVKVVVPGIVKAEPKCASGGVYTVRFSQTAFSVTCSVHGSGPQESTAPPAP